MIRGRIAGAIGGIAGLTAVTVAISCAGCTAKPPWRVDNAAVGAGSPFLKAITLAMPSPAASLPSNDDFVVRVDGQYGSFWRRAAAPKDGRVVLKATTFLYLPTVGDRIAVMAIDRQTGDEQTLATATVGRLGGGVFNGAFAGWGDYAAAPPGWSFGSTPPGMSLVHSRFGAGESAATIEATGEALSGWTHGELWQRLNRSYARFSVYMKPTRSCAPQPPNQELSGVQLEDGRGDVVGYCISQTVNTQRIVEVGDRSVYVVDPGIVGQWNRVLVDPNEVSDFVRLYPDRDGNIVLQLALAESPSKPRSSCECDQISFSPLEQR